MAAGKPLRPDETTAPAPVRHGVAERLMMADISGGLFGGEREIAVKVGRFVLLDELGAGGMGRVFRAYDPELDRSLALKVLKREAGDVEAATMRLRVEALALAKLNHPNVVTIHEVGVLGDELFLAMELVDGRDLGGWAREHPAPRPFVEDDRYRVALGYLRQAATGLAAAHAAGLVHRDFKPSNVLVGTDDRVRVADFGLARAAGVASGSQERRRPETATLATPLTTTGRVAGTPRYMAPEQQLGLIVDARTDQFSFCTTAWEILFGEHPWRGDVPGRKLPSAPAGAPATLVRTLHQGLDADPAQRHATMDALLVALPSERPTSSGLRGLAIAAAGAAGTTAVAMAVLDGSDPCAGSRDRLIGVWDDAKKDRVRDAVLGSAVPFATTAWARLEPGLDAYAGDWAAAHEEACAATEIHEAQTTAMMDAKMACLAERRRALAAFVSVVEEGTVGAIERASLGAADLPRVEPCRDDDYVIAGHETPSGEQAEEVDALRNVIAESAALRQAGEYQRARDAIEHVRARVEAVDFPPLTVDYTFERARVAWTLEDWELEASGFLSAYLGATRAGRRELASDSASFLAVNVAVSGQHVEARRWIAIAEAMQPATPDTLLAASLSNRRGDVELTLGEPAAAVDAYEHGLQLLEAELGPDAPQLIEALKDLALGLIDLGRFDDARAHLDRALALSYTLGENHPTTAAVLWTQAGLAMAEEDLDRKRALGEQVLAIHRATYGDTSPDVAAALTLLGGVAVELGNTTEGLELLSEANAIYATANNPAQRTERAYALSELSDALRAAGRRDESAAKAEEALALIRAAHPPTHPGVAAALHNLALARRWQARAAEALRLDEEARDLIVQRLGAQHPDLIPIFGGMSASFIYLERWSEAIAILEHEIELVDAIFGVDSLQRAQPLYNLGLCQEALGQLAAAESSHRSSLALIEAHGSKQDPTRAFPLIQLAELMLATERPRDGLPLAEQALVLLADGDAKLRADAQGVLAKLVHVAGGDHARAVELADASAQAYAALGPEAAAALTELEQWRRDHRL